ncbi:MAG: hypothetical protein CMJ40_09375 [Phycisphaerae bacterium]|nr:hypothetical protein [Phycisphaerae bacterium]
MAKSSMQASICRKTPAPGRTGGRGRHNGLQSLGSDLFRQARNHAFDGERWNSEREETEEMKQEKRAVRCSMPARIVADIRDLPFAGISVSKGQNFFKSGSEDLKTRLELK